MRTCEEAETLGGVPTYSTFVQVILNFCIPEEFENIGKKLINDEELFKRYMLHDDVIISNTILKNRLLVLVK